MSLTKTKLDALKAKDKRYMEMDANGLYIEVMPTGNKFWRLRCQTGGKSHLLSLGQYPDVSLLEARRLAIEKRSELKGCGDKLTFALWYERWLNSIAHTVTAKEIVKLRSLGNNHILPTVGNVLLSALTAQHITAVRRFAARCLTKASARPLIFA